MEKEKLIIKEWYTPFPENLKKYSNLNSMAIIFCEQIVKEILPEVNILSFYLNWESLSDETLDELAVNWNVEYYNSEFPKEQKIELIKNSYEFKKNKGTTGILEDSLKVINQTIKISEWFQYKNGKPFFYKINSKDHFSSDEINRILSTIKVYKNVRSTLEKIETDKKYPGQMLLGAGTGVLSKLKTYNENNFNLGLGSYLTSRLKVSQYQGGINNADK